MVILSARIQYHHFNTFTSVLLSYKLIIYRSQQHSTSLWYYINFRAIYIPAFNKPLIIYQFQSNINPIIQQASDPLSISEQYIAQNSTIIWSSINFRAIYSSWFNKLLLFYQFQSIIQPRIQQTSDLLSISEQYTTQSLLIPHKVSLHKHTIQPYSLHHSTFYFSSYPYYITLYKKIWPRQHIQIHSHWHQSWHQRH